MRRVLRDNGLSLAMFSLFLVFLVGQSVAGYKVTNSDNEQHHQPRESYGRYLASGAFVEATFENWESDADPREQAGDPDAPWPVRRGGLVLAIYENSLSLALLGLFLLSFVLHALGGHAEFNQQQLEHGEAAVSLWSFVTSSQFWFQSMQNWQSEFLSVGALVVLAIFLRQRGSPESKPVDEPNSTTGEV